MSEHFFVGDTRRLALEILNSVRNVLIRNPKLSDEEAIEIIPKIEKIRTLVLRQRTGSQLTSNQKDFILSFIDEIMSDRFFYAYKDFRFIYRSPLNRNNDIEIALKDIETVGQALDFLFEVIFARGSADEFDFSDPVHAATKLVSVIPDQKIAPIRFTERAGRLAIDHIKGIPLDEDKSAADAARSALAEQGRLVVEEIRRSNCDQRFLEAVRELQTKIEQTEDIVQLGILAATCEEMRQRFDQELADAVSGRLKAHLSSVQMYVAQFPEWQQYAANAALIELSEDDIRQASAQTDRLIAQFEESSDAVDPEVPRTLRWIREAVRNPGKATKRTAYALISSLENLFSYVLRKIGEVASGTVDGAVPKITTWGSGVFAAGVIYTISNSAGLLAPMFARLPQGGWLTTAVDIARTILP